MRRPSFATDTITVLRAAVVDDGYGGTELDWGHADAHELDWCLLTPMAGDEKYTDDGQRVITRWSLDAPADADLLDADRVRWRDVVYTIDGHVRRWGSPSGRLAHTEAVLKRVGDA